MENVNVTTYIQHPFAMLNIEIYLVFFEGTIASTETNNTSAKSPLF